MAPRPSSWRDVVRPSAPRLRGRSLGIPGGWRSVAASYTTSGTGGSGGGRGQANDLERAEARRALREGDDEGFNPLNAGGRLLLKTLDVLDTPRAAVVSGLFGDAESFDEFWAETSRNITFGEATGLSEDESLPAWLRTAVGFTGDVALDPLSYVTFGATRVGPAAGKEAARKFLGDDAIKFLGERAADAAETGGRSFADDAARRTFIRDEGTRLAQQAAQKSLRYKTHQVLTELEREAIGATPGHFINLPGTGRIGRTLQVDRIADAITGGRFTGGATGVRPVRWTKRELGVGRAVGQARAALGESRVGSAILDKFTKYPVFRQQIIRGTPEDAAKAFLELGSINRGNLQRRLFESNWGARLDDIMGRAKRAGVDGDDLWHAAGEAADAAGPATARANARLPGIADEARQFFKDIEQAANDIDVENPWLMGQQDYTPRLPSEEAALARGSEFSAPTGGALRKETIDFRRKYGPREGQESELLGEKLLTPEEHPNGWSVEAQIKDILRRNDIPNWYETNAYKSFPEYVRRISKRFGEESMAADMRRLGIADSRLREVITEKGLSQGQAKAAIAKMITRARQRAAQAAVRVAENDRALTSVLAAEEAQRGAQRAAKGRLEGLQSDLGGKLVATTNQPAVREWAEYNTEQAAELALRRDALLDDVSAMEAVSEVYGRLEAGLSHRVNQQTHSAYATVTELEKTITKMYDELADMYDRVAQLDSPTVDLEAARADLEKRIPLLEKRLAEFSQGQTTSIFNDMGQDYVWRQLKDLRAAQNDPELFAVWAEENFTRQALDIPDKKLESITEELARLHGQIEESEQLLAELSPVVAAHDPAHLQAQLADVDAKLQPLLSERDGLVASGLGASEELMDEIVTLANVKSSLLHEIGVVERATGRLANVTNPETIVAQMDKLREAEAIGDNIIHSIFPEMPAEVHGSRVRAWANDRMGEIQSQIDDTQGQILSAYTDRDTTRVELNEVLTRKRQIDRKLKQVARDIEPEQQALLDQERVLLEQAEAAYNEVHAIEAELTQFDEQAGGMVSDVLFAAQEELTARQWLAAMHAKRLKYEAQQVVLENSSARAQRVYRMWADIGKRNMNKDLETALELTLAHNYKQLGAVSQVSDAWMVEGLKAATVLRERGAVRSILSTYDKVLSLWKGYALSTPGTVLRNLFGGVFNNYLAADVALADYQMFLRAQRAWGTSAFERLPKEARDSYRAIREAGVLTGGGTSLEIEKRLMAPGGNLNPLSTDFKYTRFFRNRQEDVENFLRGTLAMKTIREGGTLDDAIDRVIKFHFDYDDLSAVERSVFRRIVPFYTWTRKNFPLMLEQIVQQPQKFTRFYQLKNEVELNSPEEAIVPSYFAENLAVRLPLQAGDIPGAGLFGGGGDTSQLYALPDLPFTSLNDVTDPSIMFSQMSPFIKTPIEYFFGKQFFQGIPLRDSYTPVPRIMTSIPLLMPSLRALGRAERNEDGTWSMKQKDLYMVEQFLPSFGKARRLFPSEEKYTERAVSAWLSFVFGLGLRANTPTDIRNEAYRRVSRRFEDISSLRELGYIGEDDKSPRFAQTVNAAYEDLGVERDEEE